MTTGHAGIPPEIPERAISPPSVVPTPLAWRRAAEWSARFDADPSLGRAPLDHDFVNRPLTESWARLAEASPDRLAVRDARMSLTRRQLVDLTRRIAGAIARTEAAAGPVALLLPDGACYAAALAAGLIAGRIMLLLDDGNPPARNAEIIRDARASLIIVERTDDPIATVIRDLPVLAIGDGRTLAEAGDRLDASRIGLDDPAFIVTTSGSTGRPKLVLHSHRGMAYRAQQFSASMGLTAEDRLLSTTSAIGTYAGINYLFASAYAGAEVHVATIRQIGIRGVFELMRQQRITALRSPPSLLRTLAPLAGADEAFAHVRAIRLAGDQATWDDIAALRRVTPPGCRITNSYGATETVSFNWVAPAEPRSDAIRIPAGVPFAEAEAVVANPDGNPVEPGQEGELFVRSRFAALGEIVDGTPQAGRLIPDPDDPTRRIYATGDLATQTPDVLLVLIGRRDRMLSINGRRVEPIEVEAAIRATGAVGEVAVLPRATGDMVTLVAFVTPRDPAPGDTPPRETSSPDTIARGLRADLRQQLPAYMVPTRIVVLAELPRLPGGKVDGVSLLAGLG